MRKDAPVFQTLDGGGTHHTSGINRFVRVMMALMAHVANTQVVRCVESIDRHLPGGRKVGVLLPNPSHGFILG